MIGTVCTQSGTRVHDMAADGNCKFCHAPLLLVASTSIEEVSVDDLAGNIGEGVHTGLRKGSEAEDSHTLWKAISDSDTSAWSDAVQFCAEGLDYMGYKVYRPKREGE